MYKALGIWKGYYRVKKNHWFHTWNREQRQEIINITPNLHTNCHFEMTKVTSAAVLFRCVSSDQILWKDEAKVCVIIIWDWKPSWKKKIVNKLVHWWYFIQPKLLSGTLHYWPVNLRHWNLGGQLGCKDLPRLLGLWRKLGTQLLLPAPRQQSISLVIPRFCV